MRRSSTGSVGEGWFNSGRYSSGVVSFVIEISSKIVRKFVGLGAAEAEVKCLTDFE
jgi:hypothetical protein